MRGVDHLTPSPSSRTRSGGGELQMAMPWRARRAPTVIKRRCPRYWRRIYKDDGFLRFKMKEPAMRPGCSNESCCFLAFSTLGFLSEEQFKVDSSGSELLRCRQRSGARHTSRGTLRIRWALHVKRLDSGSADCRVTTASRRWERDVSAGWQVGQAIDNIFAGFEGDTSSSDHPLMQGGSRFCRGRGIPGCS